MKRTDAVLGNGAGLRVKKPPTATAVASVPKVSVATTALQVPAYSFPVGPKESVIASAQEWAGEQWADLRVSYTNGKGETYLTRHGLRVRPDLLPELERAVKALRARFAAGGA